MAEDDVDFAVAAYRDEGTWRVVALDPEVGLDVDDLGDALARFPSVGVLGLVSMNDDFFVILRRSGARIRAMLSDASAVDEWRLAGGVAELIDLPDAEDDDTRAVGDLEILGDLGVTAFDLTMLCDDDDLYPEDVLLDLADRMGFGAELEAVLD